MQLPSLSHNDEHQPGAQAAHRLFSICFQHVGGSTQPIAEFLVGLYNAEYARPDPYQLCRRISDQDFSDILSVLNWFRAEKRHQNIHSIFGSQGSQVMRELMHRFGIGINLS